MTLINPFQSRTPFLQRNWINGVNAWQNSVMGNVASSPERSTSHATDNDGAPPQKKRRISTGDSLDIDQLIHSPKTSDSRSTLRIEVLRILHKDSKKVRSIQAPFLPRDSVTTKASCRITISDTNPAFDQPRVLHCQSQVCDIITSKNPVGPHRISRINLPKPFFVPQESILVTRLDDDSFDLTDSYRLVVELENANGEHWPPLDANDLGSEACSKVSHISDRYWAVSSQFDQIYGRQKEQLSLTTSYPCASPPSGQTDYVMDVDLRWTAGFKAWKRLEKGSMPCITAIDPDAEPLTDRHFETANDDKGHAVNGINGDDEVNGVNGSFDEPFHELDDGLDGDQTPSRSLRAREKTKSYNLKVLSDQALGREKRKRRQRDASASDDGRVTYLLPTDQPVRLDFHRCVTCGAHHQSMLQLQAHLKTVHSAYKYELEDTSHGPQFRVTRHYEPSVSPSKTFQLVRPLEPFNLETFVAGDNTWITSRLSSEGNDDALKTPRSRRTLEMPKVDSGSPGPRTPSRQVRRLEKSQTQAKLIPDTGRPLFHPVSKARLRPGQEVPGRVVDSSWLLQKHRESIGDFSDVTPAEKEYIREWDEFILQQNITTTAYLPRAWLQFTHDKAHWLAAVDSRMHELAKHVSVLMARNVLNDEVIEEAFKHINEARQKPKLKIEEHQNGVNGESSEALKRSPRASQIRKGRNGCGACHLPVMGPTLLVCSNKACAHRLYHADCVEDTAHVSWRACDTIGRRTRTSTAYRAYPTTRCPRAQENGFCYYDSHLWQASRIASGQSHAVACWQNDTIDVEVSRTTVLAALVQGPI